MYPRGTWFFPFRFHSRLCLFMGTPLSNTTRHILFFCFDRQNDSNNGPNTPPRLDIKPHFLIYFSPDRRVQTENSWLLDGRNDSADYRDPALHVTLPICLQAGDHNKFQSSQPDTFLYYVDGKGEKGERE